ncbi:MAG: chemotaxis protein CheW [Methylococcaceae bacterium]|nr:chemotaxis protein CheW [Methylococcaceae bacterium]
MSLSHPWLIIDLDDMRFGLDAMLVRESLWLPELTPVEEAPLYIAGMFSLRDQLIPVTDLNLRFGHPARPYSLNDQVVVLEYSQGLMGLVVSEVVEVVELSAEAIQAAPSFDGETHRPAHLITGETRVGDGIVTLLDTVQLATLQEDLTYQEHPVRRFCPEATAEQHAVFRARAKALRERIAEEEGAHLALAVIEMGGEYFGIELEAVQEFCEISHPCPIPCCPPHVLGSMSLRGNLLTLIDLHAALNLRNTTPTNGKVVVTRFGEELLGLAVDEVHDVVYLRMQELQAAPATLCEQRGVEIKGAAPYAGKMLVVLDLTALLTREEWIVNESV